MLNHEWIGRITMKAGRTVDGVKAEGADPRTYGSGQPRSAWSGSIRVARQAGSPHAVNDAIAITTNANPNASGSRGLAPYSR